MIYGVERVTLMPMKSSIVHKFMRAHFMPFLYEHGLERPMAPMTGIACMNHAGLHIRLGYKLGVGFYDWTGNELRLFGTITDVGRLLRSLHADVLQPDDLLPNTLREQLRQIAILQLNSMIESARTAGRDVPARLLTALRKSKADHLHVPDFRYQSEEDLRRWCNVVCPHTSACIGALKTEAERFKVGL